MLYHRSQIVYAGKTFLFIVIPYFLFFLNAMSWIKHCHCNRQTLHQNQNTLLFPKEIMLTYYAHSSQMVLLSIFNVRNVSSK